MKYIKCKKVFRSAVNYFNKELKKQIFYIFCYNIAGKTTGFQTQYTDGACLEENRL